MRALLLALALTGCGVPSSHSPSALGPAGGISPNAGPPTASNFNGILGVANGGTGAATLTGVLHGNGTSAVTASSVDAADTDTSICNTTTCSMAAASFSGAVTLSGSPSVTTSSNADLTIQANGSGRNLIKAGSSGGGTGKVDLQLYDGAGGADLEFVVDNGASQTFSDEAGLGAIKYSSVAQVGTGTNGGTAATSQVATITRGMSYAAAGTSVAAWYALGKYANLLPQAAACASNALALDPTSSVVYINANSAACVVTIAATNAITASDVMIVLTSNVSGAVTFPNNSAHRGPTAATTTGLSTIGSTYLIHYDGTKYDGVSVSNN